MPLGKRADVPELAGGRHQTFPHSSLQRHLPDLASELGWRNAGIGQMHVLLYMKPPELLRRTSGGASAEFPAGERGALSRWQPCAGLHGRDSPVPAQPAPQSPGHVRHQMLLPEAQMDADTKRAAQDSWSDSEMNPRQQRWCFPAPQAQCFETRGQLYLHSSARGRGCWHRAAGRSCPAYPAAWQHCEASSDVCSLPTFILGS